MRGNNPSSGCAFNGGGGVGGCPGQSNINSICVLGPELLLLMGCVKLGDKKLRSPAFCGQTWLTVKNAFSPNFHTEWSNSCLQDLANQTLLPLALPHYTANNFHCDWARWANEATQARQLFTSSCPSWLRRTGTAFFPVSQVCPRAIRGAPVGMHPNSFLLVECVKGPRRRQFLSPLPAFFLPESESGEMRCLLEMGKKGNPLAVVGHVRSVSESHRNAMSTYTQLHTY